MSYIGILIVDDDLNKISMVIRTIREVVKDTLSISQASSVQEAIENLQSKEFHLLITDLQMPLKHDSDTTDDGGQSLIRSIYREKSKANVPMYIVGLTQFEHLKQDLKGVWRVWSYDASKEDWKICLRDLIHHIHLVKSRINSRRIETVFVEGPTDKMLIEAAIGHYFEVYADRVFIETIKYGGGASWVERQLVIWAKTLAKHSSEDRYLKAVGIFDDDKAGLKSIEKIRNIIDVSSVESSTFSILRNCYRYSTILKSIKKKGILFPTTIEDLVDIEQWYIAKEKGWLTSREKNLIDIDSNILDCDRGCLDERTLVSLGFTSDEALLITHKLDDNYKKNFCNLVCESPGSLLAIKYQFVDVLDRLRIS